MHPKRMGYNLVGSYEYNKKIDDFIAEENKGMIQFRLGLNEIQLYREIDEEEANILTRGSGSGTFTFPLISVFSNLYSDYYCKKLEFYAKDNGLLKMVAYGYHNTFYTTLIFGGLEDVYPLV